MSELANVSIEILAKGEFSKYEDWDGDKPQRLDLKVVGIVEGMTGRGRTGMRFLLEDENGKKYYFNSTARLIANGVAAATRGAMQRFGDNPDLA